MSSRKGKEEAGRSKVKVCLNRRKNREVSNK